MALGDDGEVFVAGRSAAAFEADNAWIGEYDLPQRPSRPSATARSPTARTRRRSKRRCSSRDFEAPITPEAATLYLNFNGGRLSPGSASDADKCRASPSRSTSRGSRSDEAFAQSVADEVAAALAPYNIRVVWREAPPDHVPYTMVMIGAKAEQLGLWISTVGYACRVDCLDRYKRDVAFVFEGPGPSTIALNALHEAGHTWGLDHVEAVAVMSPHTIGTNPGWGNGCLPISHASSKPECGRVHERFCGSPELQDAPAELAALFGSRQPDTVPPTARILEPGPNSALPEGEPFTVEVDVTDELGNPGWKVEVAELGFVHIGRGDERTFEVTLPPGAWQLRLTATDHQGNKAQVLRTVHVGDPSEPEQDDEDDDDGAGDETPNDPPGPVSADECVDRPGLQCWRPIPTGSDPPGLGRRTSHPDPRPPADERLRRRARW